MRSPSSSLLLTRTLARTQAPVVRAGSGSGGMRYSLDGSVTHGAGINAPSCSLTAAFHGIPAHGHRLPAPACGRLQIKHWDFTVKKTLGSKSHLHFFPPFLLAVVKNKTRECSRFNVASASLLQYKSECFRKAETVFFQPSYRVGKKMANEP